MLGVIALIAMTLWLIKQAAKWVLARLLVALRLRRVCRKTGAKLTKVDSLLFTGNSDGKISYIVEIDDQVLLIQLCGAFMSRCSYIFKEETLWYRRHAGLLSNFMFGRCLSYNDKILHPMAPVLRKVYDMEGKIGTVVFLFAPQPVGYALYTNSRSNSLIEPEETIPGGVLHSRKSLVSAIEKAIMKDGEI